MLRFAKLCTVILVLLFITGCTAVGMEPAEIAATTAPVAQFAAARGYDRRYGARAVCRLIEREIAGSLAGRILAGKSLGGMLSAAELFPERAEINR